MNKKDSVKNVYIYFRKNENKAIIPIHINTLILLLLAGSRIDKICSRKK